MRLADRLRAAFAAPSNEPPLADDGDAIAYTPAAVLVAITDRPAPGLILTLRQPHLRRHAGQIAFPGGRIDPGDRDAVAAALREAHEEIGLAPAAVDVIATGGRYRVGSGFEVTPVIGVIAPDLPLKPSEDEVAAVFEVPLAYVVAREHHRLRTAMLSGRERTFHEIVWEERRIWGATANMIVALAPRLRAAG